MKNTVLTLLAIALLNACAMTYKEPITKSKLYALEMPGTKEQLIVDIVVALTRSGYQVLPVREKTGIITTEYRNLRLTPSDADCGTTLGTDYLKDNRTHTETAFNFLVSENHITGKALIKANYRPGDVNQDMTLSCVSRGTLEKKLFSSLKNEFFHPIHSESH